VNYLVGGLAFQNAGFALLVLLLSFSGFLGFGFVFAGISIKLKESAQFLVNGTQFFFMIFSAQFFPFGALRSLHPGIVDYVSRWLPVSYSVDLFRSSLLGFPAGDPELADPATEFVIVLLFGILSPLVGYVVYRYVERKARNDVNVISGMEAPILLKGTPGLTLADSLVRRIAHQLEQRCRDVEPVFYRKGRRVEFQRRGK